MNTVTPAQWAGAFCNDDFLIVETYSGYRGGEIRDPKGRRHLLSTDVDDEALGEALLDSLDHSRFVLPEPRTDVWIHAEVEFDRDLYDYRKIAERYTSWTNDLMGRYGYKTKRAMFKSMKHCSIERKGGQITIVPSHHDKLESWTGDGISASDKVEVSADSPPSEIGAALRLAFSRCTG